MNLPTRKLRNRPTHRSAPQEAEQIPLSPVEQQLVDRGFASRDRRKWDKCPTKDIHRPARFVYRRTSVFEFVTPSRDAPWLTVRQVRRGNVVWFVDFDLNNIPVEAVFAFYEALE